MSDHRRRPPLLIRPRRSWQLGILVLVTHGAAAASALALPLDWRSRTALLVIIAASLGYRLWASVLLKAPWSLREALWSEQGWTLRFHDGCQRKAVLLPSSLVSVRLVILNFRVHALRRHALLLTPEVIGPECLRRLRARLRLEAGRDGDRGHDIAGQQGASV